MLDIFQQTIIQQLFVATFIQSYYTFFDLPSPKKFTRADFSTRVKQSGEICAYITCSTWQPGHRMNYVYRGE